MLAASDEWARVSQDAPHVGTDELLVVDVLALPIADGVSDLGVPEQRRLVVDL